MVTYMWQKWYPHRAPAMPRRARRPRYRAVNFRSSKPACKQASRQEHQ